MLDFLISWAEQLVFALIIIVIIEMIIPAESSFIKYIKVVLGIFLIYTIISPILTNKISKIQFESLSKETSAKVIKYENNINYEKQLDEAYKINLKNNLDQFYNEKEYTITKYDFDIKCTNSEVNIKKIELEIKDNNQSKNMDNESLKDLKKETSEYLGVDENIIFLRKSER